MAKLTDITKNKIIADWKAGVSQNKLAKEYELSPATINKICKGIEQENVEIVNSQVAINTALATKSEYEVNSIHSVVDEMMKNKTVINHLIHKALKKASTLLDEVDNLADVRTAVELTDKASITLGVNQRHANTQIAVQQNNENSVAKIVELPSREKDVI